MIMDQAERLRRWVKRKEMGVDLGLSQILEEKLDSRKRVIVFLGPHESAAANSNLVANIAASLARKGKKVMILDSYKGKIDTSIPLGLQPRTGLEEILGQQSKTKEIIYTGSCGVKYVKLGDVLNRLQKLDFKAKNDFFSHWLSFEEEADLILISEDAPRFALATGEVVMLVSGGQEMLTRSYAMIKQLVHDKRQLSLKLIMNMCHSEREAVTQSRKLIATVKKFQDIEVEDLGFVLLLPEVIKSLKARTPFVLKYPYSQASNDCLAIADRLLSRQDFSPVRWGVF